MKSFKFLSILILIVIINAQDQKSKISETLNYRINQLEEDETVLTWIFFTDKGNGADSYLSEPSSLVSEKSLQRRSKVLEKNNLVDSTDIPINPDYLNILTNYGVFVKQKSKWFNGATAYLTKLQISQISKLSFIKRLDIVKKFKKRYEVENLEAPVINTDPAPEGTTSLDYGNSYIQVNQLNVIPLHDLGVYGQGVTIAVMDAGFNLLAHEAFDNMNIIAAWDFVNNDPDVGDGNDMGTGTHGTQTLSAIGGYSPGDLIGTAFGADFILAKTENTDSETPVEEDNWIAALEWADSIGVDVTSTSLGYLDYDFPYTGYTWQNMDGNTALITIAADLAVAKGIVVVNSAGNEGYNSTRNTLIAPADGDSVLAIGAVGSSGSRVSFSSVGNTVDGRIKPDLMAMGSGVTVASPYSMSAYTTASGTSFSCPLAAGTVALLLSLNPSLTPMEIAAVLKSTASNSDNPNREYGWGIINLFEAVQSSGGTDTTPPEDIDDLQIVGSTTNSLRLQWTVPVDSSLGGVMEFDVRYSNSPINDLTSFNNAAQIDYSERPGPAGTSVSIVKDDLSANTLYYFSIRSRDIWNNWSGISNNASATTLYNPDIDVTPLSINHLIQPGNSKIDSVVISNISQNLSTLDYSIELTNNTFPANSFEFKVVPVNSINSAETAGKDQEKDYFGQSTEGAGGPDNFGYKWIDSNEPNGPNYEWIDISSTGTEVTNWTATGSFNVLDEGYAGPIDIGFDFKFYGEVKNQIYLSTNGFLSFDPVTSNSFTNDPIPTLDEPNSMIAPLWDDLDGGSSGSVYYQAMDNKFYVQYTNWPRYSGGGDYTFQVVLFPSGRIMLYYNSLTGSLNSSTIGIENATGNDGLQIAFNSDYLENGLAIQIAAEPEWVIPDHFSGRIYNGNSASLVLEFLTENLPLGNYSMDVEISSNDPDEAIISIPVNMSITNEVPVELQSFSAEVEGSTVTLKWVTASETNNKGFSVQRASEGNWKEIGFVEGKGSTTEITEYNFSDVNISYGEYKYRLKQIDFDGSFAYSNTVEISFIKSPAEFTLMQNYPNPFNPTTSIKFVIPYLETGNAPSLQTKLIVFDILGKKVATLVNEMKEPGNYEVEFDASNLPSGIYFYSLSAGKFKETKKLVLMK